jgi:prepilin-type N-terminal cleavage/methylation domain-containing protein
MQLNRLAFTLIELLVVIAVIGILSGLIVISMNGITDKASIAKGQVFSNSLRNKLLLSLVSEWKFDNITDYDSGTKIINSTANNISDSWGDRHGRAYGGPLLKEGSDCVSGKCVSFDGVDDYIQAVSFPYVTIHGPSTIEMWLNISSIATADQRPFSDSCQEWGIRLVSGVVTGIAYSAVPGTTVPLNSWHHIVLSHDHPTGTTNTKIYLYIDGIKVNEITWTYSTQNGYYDSPYIFGADSCSTVTNFFSGLLDEFRYYKGGMVSSFIKERYYIGLNSMLSNKTINKEEYLSRINSLGINE